MTEKPVSGSIQRIATFRKNLRDREITQIYLANPTSQRPFFSANVAKSEVIKFLKRSHTRFEDHGDFLFFESGEDDEMLRRLVIFLGVRQSFRAFGEYQLLRLIDLVRVLTAVESLFWFSRFMRAYDWSPRMKVLRVAKAFKVLYGL